MWSYWAPEVIHWNYITEMRDLDEFSDFGCQCILAGKYLQYEKKQSSVTALSCTWVTFGL